MRRFGLLLFIAVCLTFSSGDNVHAQTDSKTESPKQPAYDVMNYRSIGPFRGGRSCAVAGVPGKPMTFYFGGTGGGVWRTDDGASTWRNISDGFFGGSVGSIAIAPSDPNIIYVGGGEKTLRGNFSHGDGIWKSVDAGNTWQFVGLADSRQVPRIRIHPKDPNTVYVAALGHVSGPNQQRGVFRSTDGGENWKRVLFANDEAGAVDLVIDPNNPRVLYASTWRVKRNHYTLESGGDGSALWKSTDGGDTWTDISRNDGLPKKSTLGIIGVTVSPVDSNRLWAMVEANDGGLFRSDNAGKSWTKINDERKLRQRAWYYTRLYADTQNRDRVYVLNVQFHRSNDGGKTFSSIRTPHGDHHDLWIDPDEPERFIVADDGGAQVTYNNGVNFSTYMNQPTAQFYRVTTDNHFPYRIYGAQQDNSTVRISSRGSRGGIGERDWEPTAGGESGHIAPHPDDPEIVYGGSYGGYLGRRDHRTGQNRNVNIWPDNPIGRPISEVKFRFQWNFPIFFSPHDSETLYSAAQVLFKSTDEGQSWEPISPDLTRDDKSKQGAAGGPITKDNTGVEVYCTIFSAAESHLEKGVIWCGSDDGLIHVTKDGGENWDDVTPPDLPEWTQINSIEIHPTKKGGLYVAGTRYKLDDYKPYLLKTTDYGKTWTMINDGIDPTHFTRVVRADPEREGLLYAGTERGVYVSYDDGKNWESFQLNLPIVPVTDLAIKENDLIVATQGRSFWVLDDLSMLHQWKDGLVKKDSHLFDTRPIYRGLGGGSGQASATAGANPRGGVTIRFWLRDLPEADKSTNKKDTEDTSQSASDQSGDEEADDESDEDSESESDDEDSDEEDSEGGEEESEDSADENEGDETSIEPSVDSLEITDANGDLVKRYSTKPDKNKDEDKLNLEVGMNNVTWNTRYAAAETFEGMVLWAGGTQGPSATPGTYTATLTINGETQSTEFEIKKDPRVEVTAEEYQEQFDFLLGIRDKLTETHVAIKKVRDVRIQINGLKKRLKDKDEFKDLIKQGDEIVQRMTKIEETLYQTKSRSGQDPLNFPIRLNNRLSGLVSVVSSADGPPTKQAVEVHDLVVAEIDKNLADLQKIFDDDVTSFNNEVSTKKVPFIFVEDEP